MHLIKLCVKTKKNETAIMSLRLKISPHRSIRWTRFPIKRFYFNYQMTFSAYICCFCAQLSCQNLLTLTVSHIISFIHPMRLPILRILRLSIWSHFRLMEWSLRMRRITWPITGGGGKNHPHFWNPWPQFVYSLCHFQGATTQIRPGCGRIITFIPLWRLQSSLRMLSMIVSRELCIGVPQNHM